MLGSNPTVSLKCGDMDIDGTPLRDGLLTKPIIPFIYVIALAIEDVLGVRSERRLPACLPTTDKYALSLGLVSS